MRSTERYIAVWERAEAHKPVEGTQCDALRTREAAISGQIGIAREEIASLGRAQQACQAGVGEDNDRGQGGTRKPTQCSGGDAARKRELEQQIARLSPDLDAVRSSKAQAGCFY